MPDLAVALIHQRRGLEVLDRRAGPAECRIGVLLRLEAGPVDGHRRRVPSFGGEEPVLVERVVVARDVVDASGPQAVEVARDQLRFVSATELWLESGGHPV